MESLKLSFESIMPIFLLMLLGYVIKNTGLADGKAMDVLNRLVFKIFLPTLLFYNLYNTDPSQVFDWKLVVFAVAGVLAVFLAGYAVVHLASKENAKRGVMLQGIFRTNFAILGIPLVGYVCGDKTTGLASLMVAVIVPLFNILAVVCLERFRAGKVKFGTLIGGILTNPLVIGCAIGGVFLALQIKLPAFLDTAVGDVASVASPLAMITLGAGFTFSSVKGHFRELLITLSARLIIVPAVMLTLAAILGFRGEALACLMVVFGAPVAVSSYSMAQQMGGDGKLAAQIVVLSSAVCLFTLFGWIFLLDLLKLF